jgi:hypothetical protein
MTEIEILAGRFGKNADSIGAVAPVTVTTSTTEIVGANVSRAYIIIQNQGIVPVFLNLGADASATAYNYVLSARTRPTTSSGLTGRRIRRSTTRTHPPTTTRPRQDPLV